MPSLRVRCLLQGHEHVEEGVLLGLDTVHGREWSTSVRKRSGSVVTDIVGSDMDEVFLPRRRGLPWPGIEEVFNRIIPGGALAIQEQSLPDTVQDVGDNVQVPQVDEPQSRCPNFQWTFQKLRRTQGGVLRTMRF